MFYVESDCNEILFVNSIKINTNVKQNPYEIESKIGNTSSAFTCISDLNMETISSHRDNFPVFLDKEKEIRTYPGVMVVYEEEGKRKIVLGMKKRGLGTGLWQHTFTG